MVLTMFESKSLIHMVRIIHLFLMWMRWKTHDLVSSIWATSFGVVKDNNMLWLWQYKHSSSHGSTISDLWTCILIIVHVMLAYVLSMGMPPLSKMSWCKCIVTDDDLSSFSWSWLVTEVNHFIHQLSFLTLPLGGKCHRPFRNI